MQTLRTRLLKYLGLLLAVLWIAAPAGAVVWPKTLSAGSEQAPCACCDSQVGIVACAGCIVCQVAPGRQCSAVDRRIATAVRWPSGRSADFAGIDIAPAEPPPRGFSAG